MSGIEATQRIREYLDQQGIHRELQPKILGVTGHVGDQYKIAGIKAGMDDIYSKPLYAVKMEEILKKYELNWNYLFNTNLFITSLIYYKINRAKFNPLYFYFI